MADDREVALVALRELVQSHGWRALCAYAQTEWGAHAVLDRIQAACRQVTYNPQHDGAVVSTMLAERAAIDRLLAYPVQAIKTLEAALETARAERPLVERRA